MRRGMSDITVVLVVLVIGILGIYYAVYDQPTPQYQPSYSSSQLTGSPVVGWDYATAPIGIAYDPLEGYTQADFTCADGFTINKVSDVCLNTAEWVDLRTAECADHTQVCQQVSTPQVGNVFVCTDTDGGKVYSQRGKVRGLNEYGRKRNKKDFCRRVREDGQSIRKLTEYYCGEDQTIQSEVIIVQHCRKGKTTDTGLQEELIDTEPEEPPMVVQMVCTEASPTDHTMVFDPTSSCTFGVDTATVATDTMTVDDQCDPVDGEWSPWSNDGICVGNDQRQVRMCNNPEPSCDGAPCVGLDFQFVNCIPPVVSNAIPPVVSNAIPPVVSNAIPPVVSNAIDGQWTDWYAPDCPPGQYLTFEQRDCDNPPPSNGGQLCLHSDGVQRVDFERSFTLAQCANVVGSTTSFGFGTTPPIDYTTTQTAPPPPTCPGGQLCCCQNYLDCNPGLTCEPVRWSSPVNSWQVIQGGLCSSTPLSFAVDGVQTLAPGEPLRCGIA